MHWRPKVARHLVEQLGTGHRGRIDRHLVGPGLEQGLGIGGGPHTAADGQRQRQHPAHRPHHLEGVAAILRGGRDVEQDQLVGTLVGVRRGPFDGIAGVAQTLELDPLDHPAARDVETGDRRVAAASRHPRRGAASVRSAPGPRRRRARGGTGTPAPDRARGRRRRARRGRWSRRPTRPGPRRACTSWRSRRRRLRGGSTVFRSDAVPSEVGHAEVVRETR